MTPYYQDESVRLFAGDCLDVLRDLPDNSVDAVVTDPPYGLAFMGRAWDDHVDGRKFGAWCEQWATECLRVIKPGGHLLAFGGTRTYHRLGCAIEDAGFEMRDSITWLYGSGFPKSLDVSKAIDKAAGAEREVVGSRIGLPGYSLTTGNGDHRTYSRGLGNTSDGALEAQITAPATDAARQWSGWGTALKPASEPIVVARKPLSGTVAANVLRYGTGALNVDGCRVPATDTFGGGAGTKPSETSIFGVGGYEKGSGFVAGPAAGRWPTNVVLSHGLAEDGTDACANGCLPGCAVRELDAQSGTSESKRAERGPGKSATATYGEWGTLDDTTRGHSDSGGASRFFPTFRYEAKAPTSERPRVMAEGSADTWAKAGTRKRCALCGKQEVNVGTSACSCPEPQWQQDPTMQGVVAHPTVKPLDLMRWLVRLVTPPGGTVLEPFAGSGTTAEALVIEGFQCIAIEREPSYLPLIVARLSKPIQPDLFGGAA